MNKFILCLVLYLFAQQFILPRVEICFPACNCIASFTRGLTLALGPVRKNCELSIINLKNKHLYVNIYWGGQLQIRLITIEGVFI